MRSHWTCVLLLLAWSSAACADDIDDCNSTTVAADDTRKIEGCTLLIKKGKLNKQNLVRAYNKRASAHVEKGDFDAAIADYTQAIEIDPKSDSNYIGRAEAYEKKRDFGAAISNYTKAIEVDPKSAWTYNRRGDAFKEIGNYDAAISDYTKAIEVDPNFCCIDSSRADANLKNGDYDAAISDYTKTIDRDPKDAIAYNGRAGAYLKAGKAVQGLPDAERSLELRPNDPAALDTRGHIFESLGRREEAIADFRSALASEPSQQESKDALQRLGATFDEIEGLHERIIKLDNAYKAAEATAAAEEYAHAIEARHGTDSVEHAFALSVLVDLHFSQKRYDGAEPYARRVVTIREKSQSHDRLEIAKSLTNLAAVLNEFKLAEAEVLARRALDIRESALRPNHPRVAESLNNLAIVLFRRGQYPQAEALARRAVAILENDPGALGPPGQRLLVALLSLAAILERQERQVDAEAVYRRALMVAEPLEERRQKEIEDGAPAPSRETSTLGKGSYFLGCGVNWPQVLANARLQTEGRFERSSDRDDLALSNGLSAGDGPLLRARVQGTYRMGASDRHFQEEGFVNAQRLLLNGAARAVSQLAARFGSGVGALASLVREQQDRMSRRSAAYNLLRDNYSFGQISRIEESEDTLRQSIADQDKSLDVIEARLKMEFPSYAALASPEPLSITDVQAQLSGGEALVLFLDMDKLASVVAEETFVWVVTKTDSRWVRSDLGTKALTERVAALRCGLDSTNWIDAGKWPDKPEGAKRRKEAQVARRERCKQLIGMEVSDRAPPPFDLTNAYEVYQGLFGRIEDLIKDKSLLIVPSGPLTQLPFQVLVAGKPGLAIPTKAEDYANAQWLIHDHPITVLPSVASLKALRRDAKPSQATIPFIGFGNPLLLGPNGNDRRAFAKQTCPKAPSTAEPVKIAGLTVPEPVANLFRGGLGDVAALRGVSPLPETADELCAIARETGAPENDIHLGARATETAIKNLNAEGALGKGHVVHFATHGLVAGETERVADTLAEPALILTPPATPTKEDDGLLTASEVTELNLDADWVVLSACNTAAGGEKGNAEALSGLARAFFYAGARALLVSHWYVDSRAAVLLTTDAFAELKRNPGIGRAGALRHAMLVAMNDPNRPRSWTPAAHPAVWAPFVVVGEGGASNRGTSSEVTAGTRLQSPVAAPVPGEIGSVRAANAVTEPPTAKKKTTRRRKPTGEWDWLSDIWGQ